jgi:hypothetical protein
MTQSTKSVTRLVRVTVIIAMIVATSGMLEGAGLPIFSAIGGIVQNFAAAQSEAKRLRDKAVACLRHVNREVSYVSIAPIRKGSENRVALLLASRVGAPS